MTLSDFFSLHSNEFDCLGSELDTLKQLGTSYLKEAAKSGTSQKVIEENFKQLVKRLGYLKKNPPCFQPYHPKQRAPFDYFSFAVNFFKPLVDKEKSVLLFEENCQQIEKQLNEGANILLFGNHQVEPDPQIIAILLEEKFPKLAKNIIFVAGNRVTSDPISVPFSLGTDLICVYSKKYLDFPPEEKEKKILHNKKTIEVVKKLLQEGGKCIYLAPSGGRDRKDDLGLLQPAAFDPQSIELFYLLASQSDHPAYYYPLSIHSYDIAPPPQGRNIQLGEDRCLYFQKAGLAIGQAINEADYLPINPSDINKKQLRSLKAEYIQNQVAKNYLQILECLK